MGGVFRAGALRLLTVVLVSAAAVQTPAAFAATGDFGFKDHSYAPVSGSPTGSKPESKLWFNRGWWAVMFDPTSQDQHIYRLDRSTNRWLDTGVAVDPRSSSRADVLWDAASNKLYVASHEFTTSASSSTTSPGRLWRFSYDAVANRYTLDSGFPVAINSARTETLVIAKDSGGTLWATWTLGSKVYVNHSTGSDSSWGTPYVVPVSGTSLTSDDISSLIAFGGNKIGVMWSNQSDTKFYFAVHTDGAGDSSASWSGAAVPTSYSSDDHINLKTDSAGRVYAAVKHGTTTSTDPLTSLLVRSASGTWSRYTLARVQDNPTRPIVMLDEEHGIIHAFETNPESGGTIYEKTSSMTSISFPTGRGTPVVQDGASADMNDVTSTKQNVNSTTGLVVQACNVTTAFYWHADESLGSAPAPSPPVASFTFSPAAPETGQAVTFTSTSTDPDNDITQQSWDLNGDGTYGDATGTTATTSFATAGGHVVNLKVTDSGGQTSTKSQTVTVIAPSPPVASFTFSPSAPKTGDTVTFTSTSTDPDNDIAQQSWDLDGDGTYGDATGTTASTTYTIAGSRTVSLKVTDSGGRIATTSQTVTVTDPAPPVASFTFSPAAPKTGQTVTFTSTSTDPDNDIAQQSWDLNGDGTYGDQTGTTATTSFSTIGDHTVGLKVTDSGGRSTTASQIVSVQPSPPVASFTFSPAAPKSGDTVTFTSTSTDPDNDLTQAAWDLDGDGAFDDATGASTTTSFTAGAHTVALQVTDASGLTATASQTVTVNDPSPPVASFTFSPAAPQTGQTVSFSSTATDPDNDITQQDWDLDGDGTYGDQTGTTATKAFSSAGTYTVGLKVTDGRGLSATATQTVTVTDPPQDVPFTAIADAYASSSSPDTNYGGATTLKVRTASKGSFRSYITFDVRGLTRTVIGAKIRLVVTDSSTDGGDVFLLSGAIAESALTWSNAPPLGLTPIATGRSVARGTVDINLGTAISADGTYTLAFAGHSSNAAAYASRETTTKPQLILTVQ